jgi:hypothetical protein
MGRSGWCRNPEETHLLRFRPLLGERASRPTLLAGRRPAAPGASSTPARDGNVLRVETTINQPRDFKMLRYYEVEGKLVAKWVPMSKGVANLKRFFEVASASNERYLDALGTVCSKVPKSRALQALDSLSRPHTSGGQHVPRMQPLGPEDCRVFQAVLHGFRNRDIAKLIYPTPPSSPEQRRRRSAHVSRTIARLRGHLLVTKVKGSHLYRITAKGTQLMTTAVRVRLRDFPEQYAQVAA